MASVVRAGDAAIPLRTRGRAGLGAAGAAMAAALALSPAAAGAQTLSANSGSDLLQPSLDGNPPTPPRFRRTGDASAGANQPPPPGQFAATSRIGATPIYGSPTGLGEGNTGYDSSNTPRRKRKVQRQPAGNPAVPPPETTFVPVPSLTPPAPSTPPVPNPPIPPEVHPAKAASRPGAVLPAPAEPLPVSNPPPEVHPLAAASRPGAVTPVPPPLDADVSASTPPPGAPPPNTLPLGAVPQRLLPIAEGDPYAALGIRAGSFLLLPAVEFSAAYSQNPERAPGSPPAAYFVQAPELQVHSDWERHALDISIKGSYTEYSGGLIPSLNAPYLDARADGRIDVLRNTQIVLQDRYLIATDNPGSPNLQAGLARLPINMDVGGTLGVVQEFNRLSVSLKGTFDRNMYQSSLLTDGELSNNADRNFDQYAGILRVGYELNPGLKPFVEVQEDERIHDLQFDRNGQQRDSVGTTATLGSAVDLFGSLTGEMGVGYTDRHYQEPTFPDVSGVIANGALIWQATALTTAKLSASSEVYETILAGTSGTLTRDLTLQVDHAFVRWLVGTLSAGYGTDDYFGAADLFNRRYFVSGGLTYKLNRDMQIKGVVREDWQTSTQPGFTYTATSFLLGLRLQR